MALNLQNDGCRLVALHIDWWAIAAVSAGFSASDAVHAERVWQFDYRFVVRMALSLQIDGFRFVALHIDFWAIAAVSSGIAVSHAEHAERAWQFDGRGKLTSVSWFEWPRVCKSTDLRSLRSTLTGGRLRRSPLAFLFPMPSMQSGRGSLTGVAI